MALRPPVGVALFLTIIFLTIVVAVAISTRAPRVSVGPPAIICEGTPTDFTCEEQT